MVPNAEVAEAENTTPPPRLEEAATSAKCVATAAAAAAVVTTGGEERGMRAELLFLQEAHRQLGSLGWCVLDDGCLLKDMVDALRKELRILTAHTQKTREVSGRDEKPREVSGAREQCYVGYLVMIDDCTDFGCVSSTHLLSNFHVPLSICYQMSFFVCVCLLPDAATGPGTVLLLSLWPPPQEG